MRSAKSEIEAVKLPQALVTLKLFDLLLHPFILGTLPKRTDQGGTNEWNKTGRV